MSPKNERPVSVPVDGTGPTARALLERKEFDWRVLETPHVRLHVPRESKVIDRAPELADSVEIGRDVALKTLGELNRAGEPKMEVFLVDSRQEMKRIAGRTIAGFAQPGELTAVFVAGPGYRPPIRHELTHAISFVRWGERRTNGWISEGIATLAQGKCQGHSIDEIAAGHLSRGKLPSIDLMMRDFNSVPELEGYLGAASLLDYLRGRFGDGMIRALWQGQAPDSVVHDLQGGEIERAWHAKLLAVSPAMLDSARLYGEGC